MSLNYFDFITVVFPKNNSIKVAVIRFLIVDWSNHPPVKMHRDNYNNFYNKFPFQRYNLYLDNEFELS